MGEDDTARVEPAVETAGTGSREDRLARRRHRERGLAVAAVALLATLVVVWSIWRAPTDGVDPGPAGSPESAGGSADSGSVRLTVGMLSAGEMVADAVPAWHEGGFVTVTVSFIAPSVRWRGHLEWPRHAVSTFERERDDESWASLAWLVVYGVTTAPRCDSWPATPEQVVQLTDSPGPLLDLPGTSIVERPTSTTLGGRAATHVKLRLEGCGTRRPYSVVVGQPRPYPVVVGPADLFYTRGDLPAERAFDVWHVPLPEAPGASLLVLDDGHGDVSAGEGREWRQLLDSLEITVDED